MLLDAWVRSAWAGWKSQGQKRPCRQHRPAVEVLEDRCCLSLLIGNASRVARFNETSGAFIDNFVPQISGGWATVGSMALGPDGDLFVADVLTAFNDVRPILRYDGITGAFKGVFAQGGLLRRPNDLTFGPDGNLYVISQWDPNEGGNLILRYDGQTGAFLNTFTTFRNTFPPRSLTFGSDGDLYVLAGGPAVDRDGDSVYRFNGATGQFLGYFVPQQLALQSNDWQKLRFGPDGNLYIQSSFGTTRRYNGTTGVFIDTFIPTPDFQLASVPSGLGFAPDGSLYVSYWQGNPSNTGNVLHYNGTTGAFLNIISPPVGSDSFAWNQPKGVLFTNLVASAGAAQTLQDGQPLVLDASASYAPNGPPLLYSWDVNADGVFGDATGKRPTLNEANLQALGMGPGTYQVRVRINDNNGHVATSAAVFVTIQPPVTVQSEVVNDGAAQRSKVNSITLTFSNVVTIDSGAFDVVKDGGGRVGLVVNSSNVNGKTVAVLTFIGADIIGGSLADGRYTLTIHADRVHNAFGKALDGDHNGTRGGNYVDHLFRLFGDSDGDGDVDGTDYWEFRRAYKTGGNPGPWWFFDYFGDSRIDAADYAEFQRRLGMRI